MGAVRPRRSGGPARLADVAALAGVSVATASQALNGGAVAPGTRVRVREAATALRYVPRVSAQSLRTGRTTDIGLRILTTPESLAYREATFFYALIRGAMAGGDEAGLHLSVQFVTTTPLDAGTRLAAEAAARGFGAVIVLPQWANDTSYLAGLRAQGTPVVALNDAGAPADCVLTVDEAHGVTLALDHLVELGHRSVGYLAGPPGHLDAEARLSAFYRLCAERGLRLDPGHVLRSDYAISAGRHAFARYLRGDTRDMPTGWLAADDYIAAGALQAAHDAGLRVPEHFSLIGYDDIEIAQATIPPLTSVHLPMYELGHGAVSAAAMLVDQDAPPPAPHRSLRPTLTKRASVGRHA
ncbi:MULTISPECIES: LacI family DNA-binding transcriptional regulator [unclassified Micromonospora]|uniref:LacI family DNA-binding transcriptional regulator n=1 Tax=unclassified Micromonospora TaxID=2617518 RepID=UPI003644BA7D